MPTGTPDVIINFTPTGMIPTNEMTPHVPITPSEIIEQVHEAFEIGITMVHLHAREEESGRPCWQAEVYRKIIEGIRDFTRELIICVSLSGRDYSEFEKRTDVLLLDGELKPDMGSLTLSSVNFNRIASINSPDMIRSLAAEMKKKGVLAELEAFDSGMINYAKYLEQKKLLEPPHYFNLLLGNIACAQANLLHAGIMVNDLPARSVWSMAGIGDAQVSVNTMAIAAGGGVRVGLEDNIWWDAGRKRLARNGELVKRIHRISGDMGRAVMTPGDCRRLLDLQPGNGLYGRLFSSGEGRAG